MNKFTIASVALAAALAITPSASATSITGSIALAGLVGNYTTSPPLTITFIADGFVLGGTGSLGLAAGEAAKMNGGAYPNILVLATSVGDKLFATTGAEMVTLTIESITTLTTAGGDIDFDGTGLLTETGFSPTMGIFDLSTAKSGAALTFSADASVTATPEPSSLLLLGTGLLGLAFIAFRKAKSYSGGAMTLGM